MERYHPDKAVASRSINIFNDNAMCHYRNILKPRQKQITLENVLVRQRHSGSEAESSGAKRQRHSGSEAESSGAKRQKKVKESPSKK